MYVNHGTVVFVQRIDNRNENAFGPTIASLFENIKAIINRRVNGKNITHSSKGP